MAKRILLIEDDVFVSDIYTRELKKGGYDVTTAGDGLGFFDIGRVVWICDLDVSGIVFADSNAHRRPYKQHYQIITFFVKTIFGYLPLLSLE